MFSFLATGIKKYYDIGETLGKGSFGEARKLQISPDLNHVGVDEHIPA